MEISPNVRVEKRRVAVMICAALALGTALLYAPLAGHQFINYDDHQYIVENPHVSPGLTWSGLLWSFRPGYAANWHPLTWMSHMLDCTLFGLNPAGHHLINVVFHVLNSVLLFLLWNQMTKQTWRSALVAALFAWHPLRVESVAWAAERKDVLSALFWILTLMAYVRYCRKPGWPRYLGCLTLFALGLMSKPMVVTLPFVLVLIDFWPLGRFASTPMRPEGLSAAGPPKTAPSLLLEKVPFFALTLVASVLTYVAQNNGGAVRSWVELPPAMRFGNAAISYFRYIGKTFWPENLALIYPYHENWHTALVAGAVAGLAGLTILFVACARRAPYLVVGWLWFVGTLVPVIGLVQVGSQAMADRYTYIPCIGLFVLLVWGAASLAPMRFAPRRAVSFVAAGIVAAACMGITVTQLKYWQTGEKLFRHTIAVTRDNYVAYECLGKILENKGDKASAFECYAEAVRIEPRDPLAQYNLGTALVDRDKREEGISHFATALKEEPKFAEAHNNWGKALLDLGRLDDAREHFSKAASLQPGNAEIRYNLGTVLMKQQQDVPAIAEFQAALRLKPDYSDARQNLAFALMDQGRFAEGIEEFSLVAQAEPGNAKAHLNLGLALLDQNSLPEAEQQLAEAVRLTPQDAELQYHLGTALVRQHRSKDAAACYREALRLRPQYADALNSLAWILATEPGASTHSAGEAVQMAQMACERTLYKDPAFICTLAAAYAQSGQFSDATTAARKARTLAAASGDQAGMSRSEELIKLFESGRTVEDALKPGSQAQ